MAATPEQLAERWRVRLGSFDSSNLVIASPSLFEGAPTQADIVNNAGLIDGMLDVFPARTPGPSFIEKAVLVLCAAGAVRKEKGWAMKQAIMVKSLMSRLRSFMCKHACASACKNGTCCVTCALLGINGLGPQETDSGEVFEEPF